MNEFEKGKAFARMTKRSPLETILIQRSSGQFTDEEALTDAKVFEPWGADMKYGEGQIVRHPANAGGETLYRIVQPGGVDKSQASQAPDSPGMLAVYRPIILTAKGTIDDPITYVYGTDCTAGKYYSYEGSIWLCNGDMLPCIWPPGTAGLWQWSKA